MIYKTMTGTGPIQVVQKLWGREEWYFNEKHCLKELYIKPGYACSLHYHPVKDEGFLVEIGPVTLEVDGVEWKAESGEWVVIPRGTPHRFSNNFAYLATILESSTHHDEADVVRLEPSRKLKP